MLSISLSSLAENKQALTIKNALILAEKKNPYFLAETNKLEVAKAEHQTAKLLPNPNFNNQELITSNYQRSNGGQVYVNELGTTVPIPSKTYPTFSRWNRQDWLQLTMKIPVAGQRSYAIRLAQKNLAVTYKNLEEFKRNLFFLVATKWMEVWLSGQKLQFIQKAKKYSDELLKINEIRLKNQVITKAEYNRTRILSEQYIASYLTEEQNYKNELENLRLLVGDESINSIQSDYSLPIKNKEDMDYDSLVNYALLNRTDISGVKLEQESAFINLELQKANSYPQPEVGLILNPQNGQKYYGTYLSLPLPIFNRNQGGIRASQAVVKNKIDLYNAMEWNIKKEVKNALGSFQVADTNYKMYTNIYELSDNVLETIKYSYLKGGTTIIDYLEAQKSWFEAQDLLFTSIYVYKKSYLELLYVTGKILKYDEWNK